MEWNGKVGVIVSVHHLNARQILTNGKAEDDDLEGGDEELEEE